MNRNCFTEFITLGAVYSLPAQTFVQRPRPISEPFRTNESTNSTQSIIGYRKISQCSRSGASIGSPACLGRSRATGGVPVEVHIALLRLGHGKRWACRHRRRAAASSLPLSHTVRYVLGRARSNCCSRRTCKYNARAVQLRAPCGGRRACLRGASDEVTVKGTGKMADPGLCKVDDEDAEFAYRDVMVSWSPWMCHGHWLGT